MQMEVQDGTMSNDPHRAIALALLKGPMAQHMKWLALAKLKTAALHDAVTSESLPLEDGAAMRDVIAGLGEICRAVDVIEAALDRVQEVFMRELERTSAVVSLDASRALRQGLGKKEA
jgi:hypothetical protein